MDIKTFKTIVPKLPSHIAVLVTGATGVGKSDIFHQIADTLGMEIIDRRLSQMTEGDIIGLPSLEGGVTQFIPVEWIKTASERPVCLFLDEINRATVEVQQCAFQLVLDRELNGVKLHPQTRVFAAINEGGNYQVNDMGPALIRRFWKVDLSPTVEDWLTWAKGKEEVEDIVIDFIDNNHQHLNHTDEFESGKVYPNPASWYRFCQSLNNIPEWRISQYASGKVPDAIYSLATGFVGIEAAISLNKFVENYEREISAEDLLDRYDNEAVRRIINDMSNDKANAMIAKLEFHANNSGDWTVEQANNACKFVKSYSGEMVVDFFNRMMDCKNVQNLMKVHKIIGAEVVDLVNSAHAEASKK